MKNPQAFPFESKFPRSIQDDCYEGMTLLDYFAGQAIASFTTGSPDARAENAYIIARAMLEEREKTYAGER